MITMFHEGILLLVGTYSASFSKGVYAYRFDQESGRMINSGTLFPEAVGAYARAELSNASYLTFDAARSIVYAVSENGVPDAEVAAFSFDAGKGVFTPLGSRVKVGGDPCYIETDGTFVLTADYSGGTMSVIPLDSDGKMQESIQSYSGSIGGPDAERQQAPHVHTARFSPDGKHIYATDFSADRLLRFDLEDGIIKASDESYHVHPSYGPRHIEFSPDGSRLYVLGELSGDITVFALEQGRLRELQVVTADRVAERASADIHLSPDGRFLYASCRRKNDGIAVFRVLEDGTLEDAGYVNTGLHPRNFAITPNGKFLLCACRDSDAVEVYAISQENGFLSDTGERITISMPVCLKPFVL